MSTVQTTSCIELSTAANHDSFETLIAAAVRAPSGDNTQPWHFDVDPAARQITLSVNPARDPSPMNAGQRMARIAVGAALENLLRAAPVFGWHAELQEAVPPALAVVHLRPGEGGIEPGTDFLPIRVTNRRLYNGQPIPPELLVRLRKDSSVFRRVCTYWIAEPERLTALASLIGQADAVMFGDPSMRQAFLAKVRFDLPPDSPAEEGLPLGALELTAGDRIALRIMRRLPNGLLRLGGIGRVFAAKARQLVESASGLCLLVAPDSAAQTDLHVGQTMQGAWLALTALGLAAQPMMSLPVLDNALEHGTPELIARLGRDRLTALATELRRLVPEIGAGRSAFLLRFGFAPPPSGRTGRLPPAAVMHTV
jgi:hypothetical protein